MLGRLRKAGEHLLTKANEFDTAYARRAEKDMGGADKSPIKTLLGGAPLSEIGEVEADSQIGRLLGEAAAMGVRGTNIGYRYGLPAAGVTVAGVGLQNLTQDMSKGELPLS